MNLLRELLEHRSFEVLREQIGITGRELVVLSPEGRVLILCAASDSPYLDVQRLEAVLYGEPEPGPILGWTSPLSTQAHGV